MKYKLFMIHTGGQQCEGSAHQAERKYIDNDDDVVNGVKKKQLQQVEQQH